MVLGKEACKETHESIIFDDYYFRERPIYIIQLPDRGQCLVGSLTGAVASQNVTEAFTKVG